MLWDVVRDFFVQYVFGGVDSLGESHAVSLGGNLPSFDIGGVAVSLSDWLSTTACVIVLAVLVLVCFRFVWWLTKLVSGLFFIR